MSVKKIPLFVITCLVSVSLFGFIKAEDDPIKKAAEQLSKWVDSNPQEKVYLHLDKPYYALGDDIWFKAYVTVGPKHQLSALSAALNVDLIDDRDSIKQSIKIPISSGVGYGDFSLADTLKQGNYRIRAYTNWMRNAGPDYFFDKTITIGSVANNSVYTHADFKFSTENGQQRVNAIVNYTDVNGAILNNKEVSYEVIFNNKAIAHGKGITDAKGNLSLSFVNSTPAALKSGRIVTKIKTADKASAVTNVIPVKATSNNIDVQFFPESGSMVAGLPTKVAFKAVGADGLGKDVSGTIVDDTNQEVAQITTEHLGMGSFMLMPETGKTYTARVTFNDGSKATFDLPKALEQGYVLTVNTLNDPDNIGLRISASPALAGANTGAVSLVAQSGGVLCFAAKNVMHGQVLSTKIPKSKFPTGIVQFTLFNAAGQPVNERLVFIKRNDQLKLNVTSAEQTSAPRQKVQLQITSASPDDKPAVTGLSAAVINESKVPVDEASETTILSQLLLSADIKGYIEKPNYYFLNNDKKTDSDLDLLMMTQGYRRFDWKQIMNDVFKPIVYQPERTLQISGRVHTSGNKPVAKGKVTLLTTAGGTFILDTLTDDNGNFAFNNLIFKDSIRFVIQARTQKNKKDVQIELNTITPQPVTPNVNAPDIAVNISDVIAPYLKSSNELYQSQLKYGVGNHNILLKEVTIREKKKPVLDYSSNLNGAGNADQIVKGDLFRTMGCPTITDCLQGRLLGVVFRNGIPYSTRSYNQPMQIIVDGIYVEPDFLSNLNPFDIGSIEVLRNIGNTAIYGTRGANGVLVVNTRRGGEDDMNTTHIYAPGIVTYAPKGYYRARTFYSPQYDDPKTNKDLADLRSTIYWKPNIVTDKDGKSSIEFYNAAKGTYRVVVEGIDLDGNIGRFVYRYKVE